MNNAHDFMVGLVASHFGTPAFRAGDRVEVIVGGINQEARGVPGRIVCPAKEADGSWCDDRFDVRTDDGRWFKSCHIDSLRAIITEGGE